MRQWLILFIIIIPFAGFSQEFQVFKGDTINRRDVKGLKQGLWRKYYRTDTLCSETIFVNDKPTGTSRTWYEDGKLKAAVVFDKSGKGRGISYYESGKVMAKGNYIDQKKDSTWLYFHEKADTLSAIENYSKGVPNGAWKTFYENGRLAHVINYNKGKKEGIVKEYNDDGILIFEINYVNGVENGPSILYYIDGKPREKGNYKNGEKDGKWLKIEENGTFTEEIYKDGVLVKK